MQTPVKLYSFELSSAGCRQALVKAPVLVPEEASSSRSTGVRKACRVTSSPHITMGTPLRKTMAAACGSV